MSQKKISIILCTVLAAGAAVATVPAMAAPAQHGLVAAAAADRADGEYISFDLPDGSIQRGDKVYFSIDATSPDGHYDGFFIKEWTLPEGVFVDYPGVSEPVWPPRNEYIMTVGHFAELGTVEIAVEGEVQGKAGARFPVSVTATLEIVENDPSDDSPGGSPVSLSFGSETLRVAPGGESSMRVAAVDEAGEGAVAGDISVSAPEGLTVSVDKLGEKFPSAFIIDVAADSNLAPGTYEVGVAAKVSDVKWGYSERWTGVLPVVVTTEGDVTPAPVTKCSVTDDAGIQLWEWWPVQRSVDVEGCNRSGAADASVTVDINHRRPSDLRLTLISSDGTTFLLRDAGDTSDANATYSVDLSRKLANGTWTLKAEDTKFGRVGTLNSWTLTL